MNKHGFLKGKSITQKEVIVEKGKGITQKEVIVEKGKGITQKEVIVKKLMLVLIVAIFLVVSGNLLASERGSYSNVSKAGAQAAILEYIDNKTNYNQTYNLDGRKVTFDYLHGGLKEKGGLYVSCADFKVGRDVYDVDYYVRGGKGNYKVVKEVLHKKNGNVMNKVVWNKTKKKGSGYKKKSPSYERKGS